MERHLRPWPRPLPGPTLTRRSPSTEEPPLESLADRADHAATRHPAPALRLVELACLVQLSGVRIPESELARALALDPGRFRLLNPWRGPWTALRGRKRRFAPDPEPAAALPDSGWRVGRPPCHHRGLGTDALPSGPGSDEGLPDSGRMVCGRWLHPRPGEMVLTRPGGPAYQESRRGTLGLLKRVPGTLS